MGWSNVQQQAIKVLGAGAEVPDLPGPVDKSTGEWDKAFEAFSSSRDDATEKLLAVDNANSAAMNALQQFRAKLEKSDFKLDPKKDAKKIDQARKLVLGALDAAIKAYKTNDKTIDELTRHLQQVGKYKPSAAPI